MDDVARWPPADRADLFRATADLRRELRAEVVEKDFWVCWTLRRIFTLAAPPAGLIVKGGTSRIAVEAKSAATEARNVW